MKFEKSLDVRGEICPYPMMITNKELDSNPKLNSLQKSLVIKRKKSNY